MCVLCNEGVVPHITVHSQDHSDSIRWGVKNSLKNADGSVPLLGSCFTHIIVQWIQKHKHLVQAPSPEERQTFLDSFKSSVGIVQRARNECTFNLLLRALENECNSAGQHKFWAAFKTTHGESSFLLSPYAVTSLSFLILTPPSSLLLIEPIHCRRIP